VQIDGLVLKGPAQPFDEYIVEVITAPIHGDFDLGIGQGGNLGRPSEQRSLIGFHNFRFALCGNGLVQSLDTKVGSSVV
jgi:hypothetical protein